jgi:cytochrome c peroxidase
MCNDGIFLPPPPPPPPHSWTRSPTTFSNEYFRLLQEETWVPEVSKAKGGPSWFVNKSDRSIMMLPSDLALTEDPIFKKYVIEYAKDSKGFSKDFAAAFSKLLELGVTFDAKSKQETIRFK